MCFSFNYLTYKKLKGKTFTMNVQKSLNIFNSIEPKKFILLLLSIKIVHHQLNLSFGIKSNQSLTFA